MSEVTEAHLAVEEEIEIDEHEQYREYGRTLRALQVQIDDAAREAAIRLGRLRALYQHKYEERKVFLDDYAKRHAKVNKHGEKAKSYKDKETGFGVFYTKTPRVVYIPESSQGYLKDLLINAMAGNDEDAPKDFGERYSPAGLWEEKKITTLTITNPDHFIEALREIGIVPEDYNITIKEEDPFGRMGVGGPDGAWSPSKLKTGLTKAIDGTTENYIGEEDE
jgi:hypothetical protein